MTLQVAGPESAVATNKGGRTSGEGILFCHAVRQIDWRERSASQAGTAPREFVEDALDRLLSAMEEDADRQARLLPFFSFF